MTSLLMRSSAKEGGLELELELELEMEEERGEAVAGAIGVGGLVGSTERGTTASTT